MRKRLGAAVIGVGIYGRCHTKVYRTHPDTELVTVWSRSESRARQAGEENQCEWTTDLDRVAGDPRVQLVSVVTPDFAHTEPVLKMLDAGKHVLVEKPMAYTVAECRQMIELAGRAGAKLMVNFHNRWYPSLVGARQLIADGQIGRPVMAFLRLSDRIEVPTEWLNWAGQSGPQWFLMAHTVDLARWLLGQEVREVFANGYKGVLSSRGIDTYDAVQAQLVMEDGVVSLESSWILPPGWRAIIQMQIDVQGTEGKLDIVSDQEGLQITRDRLDTPFFLDPWTTEKLPIEAFIASVRDDTPVPVPAEEGLACTAVLEAISRSLQSGEVVKVEP
jgi:predicted dehydrogenase